MSTKRYRPEKIIGKLREASAALPAAPRVGAPPLPPDQPARQPHPIYHNNWHRKREGGRTVRQALPIPLNSSCTHLL